MKDLGEYTTRTYDVVRPTMFVVPAGPVVETEQKRGFTVRTRGDTSGTVMHTYRCPVHGEFDAMVPRSEVPNRVRCTVGPVRISGLSHGGTGPDHGYDKPECRTWSPWAGSRCGIGVSAGYVES